MVITEIFPNPTLKQCVFEIRFPNLFYIENKIGDLQVLIMEKFPESALLYRRQFVIVDKGPEGKLDVPEEELGRKIWQFKANEKYELNVLNNSLNITSKSHKTYNRKVATSSEILSSSY